MSRGFAPAKDGEANGDQLACSSPRRVLEEPKTRCDFLSMLQAPENWNICLMYAITRYVA